MKLKETKQRILDEFEKQGREADMHSIEELAIFTYGYFNEAMQQVAEETARAMEVEKHKFHTYSSENADEYMEYDRIYNQAVDDQQANKIKYFGLGEGDTMRECHKVRKEYGNLT